MKNNNNNKITPVTAVISLIIILFIFIVINSIGSGNSKKSDHTDDVTKYNYDSVDDDEIDEDIDTDDTKSIKSKKEKTTPKKKKNKQKKSKKQKIKDIIEDRIWEYDYTDVDSISINQDYGTKKKNDYIALVNLTWDQKNSASLSKDIISMYSEDLAAFVGKRCKNIQEICIFWTVPYLNDASAKCSYERKNGRMYSTDTIFDYNFD